MKRETTKQLAQRTRWPEIPDWNECQAWLVENGRVVSLMKNGEIGIGAWEIWKQAYARGFWEGQQSKQP